MAADNINARRFRDCSKDSGVFTLIDKRILSNAKSTGVFGFRGPAVACEDLPGGRGGKTGTKNISPRQS